MDVGTHVEQDYRILDVRVKIYTCDYNHSTSLAALRLAETSSNRQFIEDIVGLAA